MPQSRHAHGAFLLVTVLFVASLWASPLRAEEDVSYFRDIRPLLSQHCTGCHQPSKARGDIDLTVIDELIEPREGQPRTLVPCHPERSRLITAITRGTDGSRPSMPKGAPPLSEDKVALIRRWIDQGAIDDTPDSLRRGYSAQNPPRYATSPIVTSLDHSPDGRYLAVPGYHEVLIYGCEDWNLHKRLIGGSERIESVRFSPDGRYLAVIGGTPATLGQLQVWTVSSWTLLRSIDITHDSLFGGSWASDSKRLAFGATDTVTRVLEFPQGNEVLLQGAHDDWVLGTVFSTDDSHLVTVSRDRSMKLIKIATAQFVDNITSITPGALRGGLMSVDRHPLRDELVVAGADGVPKIYQMYRTKKRVIGDDYNLIRKLEPLDGRVFCVAYSPAGSSIVAVSSHDRRGTVRLSKEEDGATIWTLPVQEAAYSASFAPDSQTLAIGTVGGGVMLVETSTGTLQRTLVAHPDRPLPSETTE